MKLSGKISLIYNLIHTILILITFNGCGGDFSSADYQTQNLIQENIPKLKYHVISDSRSANNIEITVKNGYFVEDIINRLEIKNLPSFFTKNIKKDDQKLIITLTINNDEEISDISNKSIIIKIKIQEGVLNYSNNPSSQKIYLKELIISIANDQKLLNSSEQKNTDSNSSSSIPSQSVHKIEVMSQLSAAAKILHQAIRYRNKEQLERSLKLLKNVTVDTNQPEWLIKHYIGLNYYRIALIQINDNQNNKANKSLDNALKFLKESYSIKKTFAETSSLIASVYGSKIPINYFIKTIYFGIQSDNWEDTALKLEPKNPRVLISRGIGLYYNKFSGDKKESIKVLKKAVDLLIKEKHNNQLPLPRWGKATACYFINKISKEIEESNYEPCKSS